MVIDFTESFDAHTEYFFFRNVALKITPEAIMPVSYDRLNFLSLPWLKDRMIYDEGVQSSVCYQREPGIQG